MNIHQLNVQNAIVAGHIAMRVERDKRDWLLQAIKQGRKDLSRLNK